MNEFEKMFFFLIITVNCLAYNQSICDSSERKMLWERTISIGLAKRWVNVCSVKQKQKKSPTA